MSQKLTILAALRAAGGRGVTNVEFNTQHHIFRYSARIHELREEGHTIRTVPMQGATVRFVLEQEAPAAVPAPRPRTDVPATTEQGSVLPRGLGVDTAAVSPAATQRAPAHPSAGAETWSPLSSPPGTSCVAADQTAAAPPGQTPDEAPDRSPAGPGGAQPQLFDTARAEFDAAIPPASHYHEAA